jgi:putative thioredoxin
MKGPSRTVRSSGSSRECTAAERAAAEDGAWRTRVVQWQEKVIADRPLPWRWSVSEPHAPWIFDVGEADFEREVIQRSHEKPVIVDFWAPWCGPCRTLGPLLDRLIEERGGNVLLAKLNVDEAPTLAAQFEVQSIPLVIAFRQGRAVLDFVGLLPEAQLRQFLDQLMPSDADRLTSEAAALEASAPEQSEGLYRRALQADPRHEAAVVGLARVLVNQGKDEEARQMLDEAPSGGELGAEAERLGGILGLRQAAHGLGDEAAAHRLLEAAPDDARRRYEVGCVVAAAGRYQEGLDLLLAAAERDPTLAASKVRPVMVQIFQVIGPQSALANDYRNRLAALLF